MELEGQMLDECSVGGVEDLLRRSCAVVRSDHHVGRTVSVVQEERPIGPDGSRRHPRMIALADIRLVPLADDE